MTVLVSGASGYLGYHLAAKLSRRGQSVVALLRPSSRSDHLKALGELVHVRIDDRAPGDLASLFKETPIDAVYHLAAATPDRAGREDADAMIEANVHFGIRLLEAASGAGCPVFVNTGSYSQFDATGNPVLHSFYAKTKHEFQEILAAHDGGSGFSAVTVVPCDIYGPGDWRGKVTTALCQAAQGERVGMTAGEQILDLVHVSDAADAFLIAKDLLIGGELGKDRKRYFLSSGTRLTLKEVSSVFEHVCGRPLAIDWGALAYRPNQLFSPCAAEPLLPRWKPTISLEAGFAELVREMNSSNIA